MSICDRPLGGVAERLIATVLKTVLPAMVTGVRIPPPPLCDLLLLNDGHCLNLPLADYRTRKTIHLRQTKHFCRLPHRAGYAHRLSLANLDTICYSNQPFSKPRLKSIWIMLWKVKNVGNKRKDF